MITRICIQTSQGDRYATRDYDSPIGLYSIHSGKGGEGQVSFILAPDTLPLEHPDQVK